MSEPVAAPLYAREEVIRYVDRQGRPQRGRVLAIEAKWPGYSPAGTPPYFIYSLEHPSYHNGVFYAGIDSITSLARPNQEPDSK